MSQVQKVELERARELIRNKIGIEVPEGRSADLEEGILLMSEHAGLPPALAIEQIQVRPISDPAMDLLIKKLTINETHFFRNEPQFKVLRSTIIPDLIQSKTDDKKIRIWSAACSSGEEPYSVAMLLKQTLPDFASWNINIIGTDIDTTILDKARKAQYGEWSFRQVPEEFDPYFKSEAGYREVMPEIREMVQFHHQNLVDTVGWLPNRLQYGKMDIIFCRNVLIYFNGDTTQKIIDALYECLNPGGWLIVGHADPSQERFQKFITHTLPQTIIYQRPPEGMQPGLVVPPKAKVAKSVSLPEIRELAKRDPNQAIQKLQEVGDQPDPAGQRTIMLARMLAGRRRLQEAHDQAAKAVQLASLSAEAYYVQGTILREMGKPEEAVDVLRRAVFLDKNFALAKVQLAEAQADMGQYDRARRELQQAAEMLENRPNGGEVFGDPELTVGRLREMIGTRLRLLPS